MKMLKKITVNKTGNIFVFAVNPETQKPTGKGFWCTENGDPMDMKDAAGVVAHAMKHWEVKPAIEDVSDEGMVNKLHLLFSDKPLTYSFGAPKEKQGPFTALESLRDKMGG